MSGRFSKQKGKRAEREAAAVLSELLGVSARRAQQYAGGVDSADVIGIADDRLHIEVKHQERMHLYQWLEQSIRDAEHKCPIVIHRSNRRDWLVSFRLVDLVSLCRIITDVCEKQIEDTKNCGGGSLS